jgi:hypothetical protein
MKTHSVKSLSVIVAALSSIVILIVLMAQAASPIAHASPASYMVDRIDDVIASTCSAGANDCSLRGAIIAANANAGSTVVVPTGTYVLTITQSGGDDTTTGDLNMTANMIISGAGASNTIIQGRPGWSDRIFDVAAISLMLRGVTVRNGYTDGQGAGIRNIYGWLDLNDVKVLSNTSRMAGAGIYQYGGVLTLTGSSIAYNRVISTGYQGGGLFADNRARLLLTNTLVATNVADYGGGLAIYGSTSSIINSRLSANHAISGVGGAIMNWVGATTTLTNAVLANNSAGLDGGGLANAGWARIVDSWIVSNSAVRQGGGIDAGTIMTIENSRIELNSSDNGGGLHVENSTRLFMTHTVIMGNQASTYGGGLSNDSQTTILYDTQVLSNVSASQGGGLFNYGGTLTVTTSELAWNYSGGEGGAIDTALNSRLVLSASSITSNTAVYNAGGLMLNHARADVYNSAFISNAAIYSPSGNGGAIFNHVSWLAMTSTRILSNSAFHSGGAILNNGGSTTTLVLSQLSYNFAKNGGAISSGGPLKIELSTLSDNFAAVQSGAIEDYASLTLINSTISRNRAQNFAGGLNIGISYADQAAVLQNVTIVGNRADISQTGSGFGGGIYQYNIGVLSMTNTLLAGNFGYKGKPSDCYGAVVSLGYNLIQTTTGCVLTGTLTGVITNTDPLIGPLQNNGGSTWTYALLNGSPAIDVGDPANCLPTDQRGVARPIGLRCDIGAFEAPRWVFLPIVLK